MSGPAGSEPPDRPSTSWVSAPPLVKQRDQRVALGLVVSFWLWLGAALAAIATAAVALLRYDQMHTALYSIAQEQDATADAAKLGDVATLGIVVLVGGGVVVALLQLLCAAAMRNGRNWARVVLVVLAVVTVVYALVVIESVTTEIFGNLLTAIQGGLGVYIALVLAATIAMFSTRTSHS